MTRDEGVALIQDQLAFKTTLADAIVRQMQLAQTTLEKQHKPWFLISEDSFVNTTASEQRVEVPEDFLAETEEAVLRYVPTDPEEEEVELTKDDYDTLRSNFKDEDTGLFEEGPPEAYCLMGKYFRIFPTPDDTYQLRMVYFKKDDTLDTNIENQWLKEVPLLLLGMAGLLIAKGPIRDQVAASVFSDWIAEGKATLMRQDEERQHTNRKYQMGGPHN